MESITTRPTSHAPQAAAATSRHPRALPPTVRIGRRAICHVAALALGAAFSLPGLLRAQDNPAGAVDATADSTASIEAAVRVDGPNSEAGDFIPRRSLLDVIRAGGILMVPLLFCSFLVVVFLFERLIALRRGNVVPRPFIKRFLHQLREGKLSRDEALRLCEDNRSPVAVVFAAALRKWGRPTVEVEQAVLDAGERAVNDLRRYIRVFNGVATVSPLLGLLGTVLGMIRSFNEIATSDAMGRPELLASGISEALITTGAGLTIAIPALSLYLFFISRIDRLVMEIDALGQEVVQIISDEGLQAAPRSRTRREQAA